MDTYYKEPSANQNLLNSCTWGSKWWQIPAYCLAVHSLATRAGGRSFARRKRYQQIMQHKTRWKKRKEKWRVVSVALGIKRGHWIECEGWGSLLFKCQFLCHHFYEAFSDLCTCDKSHPPLCYHCYSQTPVTLIK